MAYPRHLLVRPGARGVFHCVSRCVRRAYLCGEDAVTGRSFEHRKRWLEQRILELATRFAVAVHAYAVMSNHVHIVLEVDPGAPSQWSDEEVARRWLLLASDPADDLLDARVKILLGQPERLCELRRRLGSLSWYMRYLKEPIARRANQEDECTGRFWEGRFKVQALLDDPAVLAAMVYVDLNPVRVGSQDALLRSPHTSVRVRAAQRASRSACGIRPLAASIHSNLGGFSAAQYLDLVEWSSRLLYPKRHAGAVGAAPAFLGALGIRERGWLLQVNATESRYRRAIGRLELLLAHAQALDLKWIHGVGVARRFAALADSS